MVRSFVRCVALFLFVGMVLCGSAHAQSYPTKNITIVLPFPAGAGADTYVRYFASKLQEKSGRQVLVENKPGAQGNIGTEYAARQKPDGYTVWIGPASAIMASAPSTFKQLPFDPEKDFAPITTLLRLGFVIAVDAKAPYRTLADLTEALKKKGDKGAYASTSNTGLVTGELYKKGYGLQTKLVNYSDSLMAVNDMLGGQVDFFAMDSATAKGQMNSGRIKALAQTTSVRITGFDDVPTMKQAGVPGFEHIEPWWAAYAPAGTPTPVIDKLEAWFNEIVKMPETKSFLNNLAGEPYSGDRRLVAKIQKEDTIAWREYVKIAKIVPQ